MEITLNIHNSPVQCYSELDDTFDNYELINKTINRLNLYLQEILKIYKIKNNINLLVADSVSISPTSVLKDSIFYIVFPAKLFSFFMSKLATIYSISEFQKYINYKEKFLNQYINRTFDWICNFALLHELFHIANGHLLYKLEIYKNTKSDPAELKKYNLEFQTMEFDADHSALIEMGIELITTFTNDDMNNECSVAEVLQFILDDYIFMNVALCIAFSTFQNSVSLKDDDYLSIDHPIASIRYSYATEILGDLFIRSFKCFSPEKLISTITGISIACNRIYFANNDFSKSLVCPAYNEKAVKHKMLLHNNINNIYKKLQKYAYIKLKEKKVLTDLSYWVDDKNNILPIAFKI